MTRGAEYKSLSLSGCHVAHPEWVPERTPEGAKRSAAVEAKRRLVRVGSRGTIGPKRGKLINWLG